MSRFWGDSSSSESDTSSSESDFSSGDERQTPAAAGTAAPGAAQFRFSSDEDVEEKRVVLSHEEKELLATQASCKQLRVALKDLENWSAISEAHTSLTKQLAKFRKKSKDTNPHCYIRTLSMLDSAVEKLNPKQAKRDLLGKQFKAYNGLRMRLRKEVTAIRSLISAYRKNPDPDTEDDAEPEEQQEDSDSEKDDASDSDSDDEKPSTATSAASTAAPAAAPQARGISYWLKKGGPSSSSESSSSDKSAEEDSEEEDSEEEEDSDDEQSVQRSAKAAAAKKAAAKKAASEDEEDSNDEDTEETRKAAADEEKKKTKWTAEKVDEALVHLFAPRSGKRKLQYSQIMEQLKQLAVHAKTPAQHIVVHMQQVQATFDEFTSLKQTLKRSIWVDCFSNLCTVMEMLQSDQSLNLTPPSVLQKFIQFSEDVEHDQKPMHYMARLVAELKKNYRHTEPHSPAYLKFMRDEEDLIYLAELVDRFYRRTNNTVGMATIALIRIKFIFYRVPCDEAFNQERYERVVAKRTALHAAQTAAAAAAAQLSELPAPAPTPFSPRPFRQVSREALMQKLCGLVFAHGDQRQCTDAMLCQVYHKALYDHFYQARDLLLMSRLQENVSHMPIGTQVLYNRAMVQIGLSAFRAGLIAEAHSCLAELYSGGRVKELLAQGMSSSRHQEKTKSLEANKTLEKNRQVPYHMHVNLELLECVHLITAGLLEVPNMAANAFDIKVRYGHHQRKEISRWFRRLMDITRRQVFSGPPETPRDHVIAGSLRLAEGDWRGASNLLLNLNCWKALGPRREEVTQMLRTAIKETGLRTYLFTYSHLYSSISQEDLAVMFELPATRVHCIVSKMIIDEELSASWHQPSATIVLHQVEPTRIQALALQVADKISSFVDYNERLFDQVTGGSNSREPGDRRGGGDASGWRKGQGSSDSRSSGSSGRSHRGGGSNQNNQQHGSSGRGGRSSGRGGGSSNRGSNSRGGGGGG
eukprot:CAMPEP_0177651392 /NCGR_PEP_ID=MMETSP0447-20121125/12522_1 /TAXON_ID=0 /ORGANISM="Stygamoeba regulata, Strain BSH-02190019" /LENGTH=978 /DNA_ID=CAMNT_0019154467 /DNA_START=98 /DNA_END=3030 /DNA_ORIENTATION=+